MRTWTVALFIAAFTAAGVAPRACANPWQVGAGVSTAAVSSSYSAIADQRAEGVAITCAWEFFDTWWLEGFTSLGHEVVTGETQNIHYPPDRAEYGMVTIGVRKDFWPLLDRGWTPWVHAGLGIGQVYWDTFFYELTGTGLALAAGVDVRLGSSPLILRGQLLRHAFSAPDTYSYGPYDVTGEVASALLVWRFGVEPAGQPDH